MEPFGPPRAVSGAIDPRQLPPQLSTPPSFNPFPTPPLSPPLPPSLETGDEALDSLSSLPGEEIDLILNDDTQTPSDLSTLSSQSPSSDLTDLDPSDEITLSPSQLTLLSLQIDEFLSDYRSAIRDRHEVEDEIRDAYMLVGNAEQSSGRPNSSSLVSGLLRRLVSQVSARLNRNFESVTPAIVVDPVVGAVGSVADSALAESTQSFLLNYTEREVGLARLRPLTTLRAVKVGTAVLHIDWEERVEKRMAWGEMGEMERREERVGGVKMRLIDNRHVIVWPVSINDWEEAEWVGHYVYLSRAEWALKSRLLGLDEETIARVEQQPGEKDAAAEMESSRHYINTKVVDERDDRTPIEIVELWGNTVLPGEIEPVKFQLFYHPDSKTILGPITYNRLFSQSHPYCPIRYDWNDSFAWGTGCGHELLNYWAADSALRNIRMDLQRATFPVILRNSGSMFNTESQSPHPGMQIPVDDPEADFITRFIGGEAPGLDSAIADNLNEARETSSFAPVLSGLGDPVQKSGAGTGATLALIEQGGQRLAQIDSYMRSDWSRVYHKILELVAQFAPDGVYYQFASSQDADVVRTLRYTPPRARITDVFRIRAMAPSASTSSETRKQGYFMLWGFATQAVQTLQALLAPTLQTSNPAGLERWSRDCASFLEAIMRKIVEYNELPGIGELVPHAPDPTPQDQLINQLSAEVQGLQMQLGQLMQSAPGQSSPPPGQSAPVPGQQNGSPSQGPGTPGPNVPGGMTGMQGSMEAVQ